MQVFGFLILFDSSFLSYKILRRISVKVQKSWREKYLFHFVTIYSKIISFSIHGGMIGGSHFYLLGANTQLVYNQLEKYDILLVPPPSGKKVKMIF